jgi:hypothetical protein
VTKSHNQDGLNSGTFGAGTNSDLVVRATWFANLSLLYAKAIVTRQQKYGGE